jgi:hypothetical protein
MSNQKAPLLFVLLFVGFWSLITLIFDGMIALNSYRQFKAASFPVVAGTITHSEVTEHHGDESTTYGVDVKYDYEVAGRGYQGARYRYGQWDSSDNSARRIVDSLPVGKQVDVHYNPDDPNDSVLAVGIQSSDLVVALFLTPFNLIMMGGWCVLLVMIFPGMPRRMAGSPKAVGRGFQRRLVLEPAPRLVPAAFVLGISSFLSIFVVAFGFGFNPPMVVIKVVWGIVLGLAAAMLVRRSGFSLRGKGLVIDDVENTLSISGNNQEQTKVVLSLRSVVDVEAVRKGDAYDVVLTYSNDEMAECRLALIEVDDVQRAESLARWVKDQILRSARQ